MDVKRFMNRQTLEIIFSSATLILFTAFYGIAISNHFDVPVVQQREFTGFLQKEHPIVWDLREGPEVASHPFYYSPTLHLPFYFVKDRLNRLTIPQNYKVVLICSDGNRARIIANLLWEKHIAVYYLNSGINPLIDRKDKRR